MFVLRKCVKKPKAVIRSVSAEEFFNYQKDKLIDSIIQNLKDKHNTVTESNQIN